MSAVVTSTQLGSAFGFHASNLAVKDVTVHANRASHQVCYKPRTQKVARVALPSIAAGTDKDIPIVVSDKRIYVTHVDFMVSSDIPQNDSDYVTFSYRAGGPGPSINTKTTDVNIGAYQRAVNNQRV